MLVSMRGPAVYIGVSYAIAILYILDCVTTYREFYPVMIYLTNSAVFKILAVNACIASALSLWKTSEWLFFGSLTTGEASSVIAAASLYFSDCLIGLLCSELPLVGRYSAAMLVTTVWQILHHVERERVNVVGSLPLNMRKRKILGLLAFAIFSSTVNVTVIFLIAHRINEGPHRTMMPKYVLVINYTRTLFTTLHVVSLLVFGAWRSGDLSHQAFFIRTFWQYASSIHCILSFCYVCAKVDPPFMLMRYFLREVMSFFDTTLQLQRYWRLTRITRGMPDAVAEDLSSETRCSICYEDMAADGKSKRLPCSHCYHTSCLQQWFQSNSTCPYCRADLLRPKPSTAASDAQPPQPQAADPPPPAPQPPTEAARDTSARPANSITGDPLVNAALEEALAADQENHLNVVLAYGRYRQRVTMRAVERRIAEVDAESRENRRARPEARSSTGAPHIGEDGQAADDKSSAESSGCTTPRPSASAAAATAPLPVAEEVRRAREARFGIRTATGQAQSPSDAASAASVPVRSGPLSDLSAAIVGDRRPADADADAAAHKKSKESARLDAYKEFRVTVKQAERKLKAALKAIDEQEGG